MKDVCNCKNQKNCNLLERFCVFADSLLQQNHVSSLGAKLLLLWLFQNFFLIGSRFVLHRVGIDEGFLREAVLFAVSSIAVIVFLCNIRKINKKAYLPGILLILAVAIIFGVSYLLHPENQEFFTRSMYGIERVLRPDCAIYVVLFIWLIDDPDEIWGVFRIYAFFDWIALLVFQLMPRLTQGHFEDVSYLGEKIKLSYSLSFGYALLLPTFIFAYDFIRSKNKLALVISLFNVVLIFLYGSRGALVLIAIFVVLLLINNIVETEDKRKRKKKIIAACIFFGCALLFGKLLLQGAASLLISMGIHSRTLQMLMEGEFTSTNGRADIWNAVISAIKQGGIFGYGAFGDRPFVAPHHYAGYSHNIFLELIVSFGVLGVAMILKMVVDTFRMLFFCQDSRWRGLYIIFFSVSCQLLLSMSFWYVMEFWAALAIANKYFYLKKSGACDRNLRLNNVREK